MRRISTQVRTRSTTVTRATVAERALRYDIRVIPFRPLLTSVVLALILAGVSARSTDSDLTLIGMRLALATVAIGICFIYDDPANHVMAAVAQPLRYRRVSRTLPVAVIWTGAAAAVQWIGSAMAAGDHPPLPADRLTLEAAAQATVGLVLAASLARRHDQPGRLAAPALLGAFLLSWLLPSPLRPWVHPEDPLWETGYRIWWTILGIGLSVLVATSWDSRTGTHLRSLPSVGRRS